MNENSLSIAFGNSLKEESVLLISNLVEVSLDAIIENDFLKDMHLDYPESISAQKSSIRFVDR